LAKSEIRLEYTGFVIFAAQLLSVATGFYFQLMITRVTSQAEYGVWSNVGKDVLPYFTVMAGVLPFWALRFTARGKEGAIKTGILANLTISLIAALTYILLLPYIVSALGVEEKYFFLYFIAVIQIVETYALNAFEQCLQAKKPHVIGYGLLLREFAKVSLGYFLINKVYIYAPLFGAMLSIILAFIIQLIYYCRLLLNNFKQKFQWSYLREWLKGSVANMYNLVGNQIASFIFIMLFVYGGEDARGYHGAASVIAAIINYAASLAFALYPKLLAERKHEDITTAMKIVLMFALPMTVGAVVLSDSYLTILSPEPPYKYRDAAHILIVLSIDALLTTISGLYSTVLLGFEKFDEKAKISFKELLKSRLFLVFSLPYLHSAITIPAAFYTLTTYTKNNPLQAALYVSILNFAARFAMFLILYVIVRRIVKVKVPWRNIIKYIVASAVMAIVLFEFHPTTIMPTFVVTAVGGILYLLVLMIVDREARELISRMSQTIRGKS
jgi:O-antigen/teichoic acid export membrane protein